MRHRNRWVTFVLLAAWLMLGPIGMAFACGAMMALCDVPCGAPSVLLDTVPTLSPLALVAMLAATTPGHSPLVRLHALDPPPRLLVLSV